MGQDDEADVGAEALPCRPYLIVGRRREDAHARKREAVQRVVGTECDDGAHLSTRYTLPKMSTATIRP